MASKKSAPRRIDKVKKQKPFIIFSLVFSYTTKTTFTNPFSASTCDAESTPRAAPI